MKFYNTYNRILFVSILLLGLGLRFYQYLMGRSMWEDETHLALNFMNYGFLRLAQPLDYIQGAPILFIWLVKLMVVLFGYSEMVFRSVPFVLSILTLPLCYYIAFDLTKKQIVALLTFLLFSINIALIYFSSELKPYTVDVAMYLILVFLAVSQSPFVAKRRTFLLSLAGCVGILLSNITFIILFCIACTKFSRWYQTKKINKEDLKIFISWLIVFLANYFMFIHNHPSTLDQRVNYAFAFCPTDILSCEFVSFLKKTIDETFFSLLIYASKDFGFPYVLLFILIVAIRWIVKQKKYDLFCLVCLPVLVHLVLSAFHFYPFWYRLILYLVPCYLLLISIGIIIIAEFIQRKIHLTIAIPFVLVCAFFLSKESALHYPLWPREIKPLLNYMNDSIKGHPHIYIADPEHAYEYYYRRDYVKDSIYKLIPWEIDPDEFYEMTSAEKDPYIFFYGTTYQFGYGDVLDDLRKKGLLIKSYEIGSYGICEIKPSPPDSMLYKQIDYKNFNSEIQPTNENLIPIWSGIVTSSPVFCSAGDYSIKVISRGSPVLNVYPRHSVFLNKLLIGKFENHQQFSSSGGFVFNIPRDTSIVFGIKLENDTIAGKEDRNSFIKKIEIRKLKK